MRADYPIYQKAVEAFLENSKSFNKLKKSQELTNAERKLLDARLLLKERNWDEAQSILSDIKGELPVFLEAERLFVLANAAFYLSDYELAAVQNLKAYKQYEKIQDRRGMFLTTYNLSVDYSRLGRESLSEFYLIESNELAHEPREEVLVYRAFACKYSKSGDYETAVSWINRALEMEKSLSEHDLHITRTVAVDILFRAGKNEMVVALLDVLSSSRGNRDRDRYYFESKVFRSLQNNSRLSSVPAALESSMEYSLKWQLLNALESGDQRKADKLWSKLNSLYPERYGQDYTCTNESDSKDIFFTYLSGLKMNSSPRIIDELKKGSKLHKLYSKLVQNQFPLRKEELIEAVWEVEYDTKLDSRFYKLIERLKKQCNVALVNINQCYMLPGNH